MMLQYRVAALAGLWTQVFFGVFLLMMYEAFYASSDAPQPITMAQIVGYTWLGQALLGMLPWNVDAEVRAMVRSGSVAYELCRPVDLYSLWYARALAWRTAPTILRAAPMCVFAALILPLIGLGEWRLQAPPSVSSAVAFTAAIVCALLLSCALTTLLNISLIWTIAGDGIVIMMTSATVFLSGMLVPLPLFPEWAQRILGWLPFAGLVDLPFRIYTGNIPPRDVALVLLRQLAWTFALILFGRWLLARGMRSIVVLGG
jgi:ABC-2 type transport system permease protein